MQVIYVGTACFAVMLYAALETTLFAKVALPLVVCLALATLGAALLAKKEWARRIAWVLFCGFLGLLSGLQVGPSASQQLQPFFGRQVLVAGRVEPLSIRQGEGYTSFVLQCEGLQLSKPVGKQAQFSRGAQINEDEQLSESEQPVRGAFFVPYSGRIRLALPSSAKAAAVPTAGSIIVTGRLEPLVGLRNPGSFDSTLYNRINKLGGRLAKAKLVQTQQDADSMLSWQAWQERLNLWNVKLREQLGLTLGVRTGALLGSMLLGGGSALDEDMRESFTANGLSHLLSVSGTHVVLLSSLLLLLLQPLPQPQRKLLVLVCLGLYAVLCGLRPPVLRALFMSSVVLFRPNDSKNARTERGFLLCLVALLLLLMKPLWLLDIGFQLSFGAAAGLIWLSSPCTRLVTACLPRRLEDFLPTLVPESLSVTMAAQLATLPILVANFHQVSLISLVSNLVLVPVLEFAILVAILGSIFLSLPLAFLHSAGQGLTSIAVFFVEQVLYQGKLLSNVPMSQLVLGSLPVWCALVYYALLVVWADLPPVQFLRNKERKLFMGLTSALLLFLLLWQHYGPQPLVVYFLDVGQGDCVVVVTPKHQVIVYDTGGLPNLDTGKQVVASFLRSLGKRGVDVLILSHYDFDHVGGAVGLMQQLQVREIILPQEALDASSLPLYEVITKTAASRGTKLTLAQQDAFWDLGDGASLHLFVPATWPQDIQYTTAIETTYAADATPSSDSIPTGNAASTVAAIYSPFGNVLLTGDLGGEEEQGLELGHFDIFKAGHHGSKNSNSAELLERLQPRLTVISCGYANRYGHPHRETLARLSQVGCAILRTDEQGCIRIDFLPEGIRCSSYVGGWYGQLYEMSTIKQQ